VPNDALMRLQAEPDQAENAGRFTTLNEQEHCSVSALTFKTGLWYYDHFTGLEVARIKFMYF